MESPLFFLSATSDACSANSNSTYTYTYLITRSELLDQNYILLNG